MGYVHPDTETTVRELVASYVRAVDARDQQLADRLRSEVATLCVTAVCDAARRVFRPLPNDVDDVEAIAQLVFYEVLPDHLARFDATKVVTLSSGRAGTFAGWVLYACPGWQSGVRRELGRSGDNSGLHRSDEQMMRIYHGCRERFEGQHGRSWTSEEAQQSVWEYMLSTKRAHYAAENPDWDAEQIEEAAKARIVKDGLSARVNELDEVVRMAEARKVASLDAPLSASTESTLIDSLADTRAADEDLDPQTLEDWTRISILGMTRKDARVLARHLEDDERTVEPRLLDEAQRNLGNPVAQFVVLGGIEHQFAQPPARTTNADAREQLVAAAALL